MAAWMCFRVGLVLREAQVRSNQVSCCYSLTPCQEQECRLSGGEEIPRQRRCSKCLSAPSRHVKLQTDTTRSRRSLTRRTAAAQRLKLVLSAFMVPFVSVHLWKKKKIREEPQKKGLAGMLARSGLPTKQPSECLQDQV